MNSLRIPNYIWMILFADPVIPCSWGICLDSIRTSRDSVEFFVNGSLHKGKVVITYIGNLDAFRIILLDKDGIELERMSRVYTAELTEILDRKIEDKRT